MSGLWDSFARWGWGVDFQRLGDFCGGFIFCEYPGLAFMLLSTLRCGFGFGFGFGFDAETGNENENDTVMVTVTATAKEAIMR